MIQSTGYLELCLFLLLTDWMLPWKEKDCWHLKKKKLKKKQRKGTCSCTYSKINAVIVFVFRKLLQWQNQVLKLEGTIGNSVTVQVISYFCNREQYNDINLYQPHLSIQKLKIIVPMHLINQLNLFSGYFPSIGYCSSRFKMII